MGVPFEDQVKIKRMLPEDWALLSEKAHLAVFEERRPHEMNRISWAVVVEHEGIPLAFATARELDSETVYWQYGGLFPSAAKSVKGLACYRAVAKYCRDELKFKRVTTYVENTNRSMLRIALDLGFIPIGIRNFKNQILLELLLEF